MKLTGLFLLLIFAGGLFAQNSDSQHYTKTLADYESMRNSGRTLTWVGGAGMATGLVFLMVASAKFTPEVVGIFLLQQPDLNAGATEAVVGAVFFAGGLTALIVGISKSTKARRMMEARQISFQPYAPPMQVTPITNIPQTGFTLKLQIGK